MSEYFEVIIIKFTFQNETFKTEWSLSQSGLNIKVISKRGFTV